MDLDPNAASAAPGAWPILSALDAPLDAIATSGPDAAPAPGSAEASRVRVLRVLHVDDVAMNREIVTSFLRSAGHRTTCVRSGSEAVTAAATTDFDVVLMDIRMPEMDGLQGTRRIRALGGARGRVPIIALTAQNSPEQVGQCKESGMDSHLSKSFDLDTLLSAVVRTAAA